MSTPESGPPNLLDEFFSASPTTGLAEGGMDDVAKTSAEQDAGEAPPGESTDEAEAVEVDEVEEAAAGGLPPAPVRRSLPPPAPSARGANRAHSAPPPRGRSSAQASAPPPPPSLRATWPGIQEPPMPEVQPAPMLDEEPQSPFEVAVEAAAPAKLEPETTPGGFGSDGVTDEEAGAFFAGLEMPSSDDRPEAEPAEVPAPSAETDMASALAASLSLRGDIPSGPSALDGAADAEPPPVLEAPAEAGSPGLFAELPLPPVVHTATEPGVSSAWPSPAKIDEWDEDWAPSLSALGAKEPEKAASADPGSSAASSSKAPAGKEERAPFRLSLPPPDRKSVV